MKILSIDQLEVRGSPAMNVRFENGTSEAFIAGAGGSAEKLKQYVIGKMKADGHELP